MAKAGALATVKASTVLDRYEQGQSILRQAKNLKVSHVALYAHLLKHFPERWKEIASASALVDLEEATEEMRDAPDMLTLMRGRALSDLQRWKLERLLRRYFGQDTLPGSGQAVQININLRSAAATTQSSNGVIEGETG